MSLQKIIERLEAEKLVRIREIRDKKEKEYEAFVAKKNKELEEWKKWQEKKLDEKLRSEENTVFSQLKLRYNSEKAKIEVEVIKDLKSLLIEKIKKLSVDEYTKLWETFIKDEDITGAEMLLSKGENNLDVNYFCKNYGLKVKEEKVEGIGGFILYKDNIVIDLTLDTLVDEIINHNILDIAQILCGEG